MFARRTFPLKFLATALIVCEPACAREPTRFMWVIFAAAPKAGRTNFIRIRCRRANSRRSGPDPAQIDALTKFTEK